ncbi:MAG: hypothetical protein M3O09_08990 [Acidobacteriota bacterium]|jgi:hypothetical protein|nr:hypothetical protein [Acidobacteriota bacterium]
MKSLRLMLSIALVAVSAAAFAQSDAQKSETQKSFDKLKTLAGTWEGHVTGVPEAKDVEGKLAKVSFRVTSMGNALMHEMRVGERADDPITMLYMEGDRLLLTHYCDAGNRPRMVGKVSPDGKTVEFDFLDVAGGTEHGHMHRAVFTIIDANHHTEDWTYMMSADKMAHPHFDLQRTN